MLHKEVVIVCDMWKILKLHGPAKIACANVGISDSDLSTEVSAFSVWLNHNLNLIRRDFDIIHVANGKEIQDCIDTHNDQVVPHMRNVSTHYDKYYFCGMHLGRCIHQYAIELGKSVDKDKIGVVFNLSLLFPTDNYNRIRDSHPLGPQYRFTMYNYVRSIKGFTTDCAPKN
jgi:hypothetical protein